MSVDLEELKVRLAESGDSEWLLISAAEMPALIAEVEVLREKLRAKERTCECGTYLTREMYAYFGGANGYFTCNCGRQWSTGMGDGIQPVVPPVAHLMPGASA